MEEFFTVVFRGDIRKLPFNPLRMNSTAFGEVVAVGIGNEFDEHESTINEWAAVEDRRAIEIEA